MRILIDINHPAQVHLFRNPISIWKSQGHDVFVVARDKDVTIDLLEHYQIPYTLGSKRGKGIFGLATELLLRTAKIIQISLKFKPDVFLSLASPASAWSATMLRKPHLAFDDTEAANLGRLLYLPFTHKVYTPSEFQLDIGSKQQRYNGYNELSYLHPNYFVPNPTIFEKLGLKKNQRFFLLRLVRLGASHDINAKGLQERDLEKLLEILRPHGAVVISSEIDKTIRLDGSDRTIPPEYLLDLLSYADMYIGEGGATATEAALLGTPAVFLYHFSGGNWYELEHTYDLMKVCHTPLQMIDQVQKYLAINDLKNTWQLKRKNLLADKIDVADFIVQQVNSVLSQAK